MEWIETTGRSVEEALESALDQLGIDERDAEVDVLEEPKTGLFGRLRSEARIRARVRPTRPRPKVERSDRGRKRQSKGPNEPRESVQPSVSTESEPAHVAQRRAPDRKRPRQGDEVVRNEAEVPLSEQADVARAFLEGLVEQLSLSASVATETLDEETVELRVDGTELGFLIGPKGATLSALQDVTRTVVNRKTGGRNGRIMVDVAGYRQKRKEALERFTRDLVRQVQETGRSRALEPMSPADRKIVHDTVNQMDGVSTVSEGEEPARRVVITPN
ncbi:MAG TPA: RNA-binding cell elongation regulator Jag/EloR [Acidimicrobiales bacterium]|nr:RNA-binding cell elongation regulator Jag/EloR [Acidimicrobiales bacterium]